MEINIKWNVCRVCLHEEQAESSNGGLIKMKQIDKKMAKQIHDCSGVPIKSDDNLPEKICTKCIRLLKYAVNFRNSCRSSDDYLKNIIKKTKSATSYFNTTKRESNGGSGAEIDEYEEVLLEMEADPDELGVTEAAEKRKAIDPVETSPSKKFKSNPIGDNDHENEQEHEHDREPENEEHVEVECINERACKVSAKEEEYGVDLGAFVSANRRKGNSEVFEFFKVDEEWTDKNGDDSNAQTVQSECSNATDNCYEEDTTDHLEEPLKHEENSEEYEVVEKKQLPMRSKSNLVLKSTRSTDKFYYVLNSDPKHEFLTMDDGSLEEGTIEFIPIESIDGDVKSEQNSYSTDDIEYIVEGADPDDDNTQSSAPTTATTPATNTSATPANISDSGKSRTESTPRWSSQKKQRGDFICDVCANHFTSRNLLNYHMRIHRNEKNYECELCFKRFNAACNLTAHMRVHTGEKPFECQFCGRRFADRSTHIKHERVHTNEKPFSCNVCGKSFSLSTTLKAHEKVHSGEKPFKCEPCHKSFKLAHQLKAHFKSHLHRVVAIDSLI